MSTLQRAIEIAVRAHAGQMQKRPADAEPYITHPLAVMERVGSPDARIVAVLHDVLEDTPVTVQDLGDAGFSGRVIRAVELLTRRQNESYADYILRCATDPLAVEVKLADLEHNSLLPRAVLQAETFENDLQRMARHAASHRFLSGTMAREEFVAIMKRVA